jgi:Ion channel
LWSYLNHMATLPTVLLTLLGIALVALALRDVFDTLFHESGRAVMSRTLMRVVWRLFRAVGGRGRLSLAGPFALIAVVLSWATLLVVGWALIVMPHMPEDFAFSTPAQAGRVVESLYYSLVTLTTVGFGDIAPAQGWLRLVTPVEALIGFGLLTASVSWLLSIYPLLSRRRSLAYEIHLLTEAESETGAAVTEMEPWAAMELYSELTTRLVSVERDMVTFPVAYYFAEADSRFALPASMPALLRLAEAGCGDAVAEPVRLRATMLRDAIGDFARSTAQRFHRSMAESTEELLEDYARDHLLGRSTGDASDRR